ncbi:hypothetical protein EVAR_96748_1 [Eumeta japonica]|uniref:Uncharacterized protein n=1 Tax=Eumeta variegata TaxID=151549 RepID=A0A4C1Y2N5_EUMVA|nr:hypothetical protein EVAR_96748_1 [Eumeta japonica]
MAHLIKPERTSLAIMTLFNSSKAEPMKIYVPTEPQIISEIPMRGGRRGALALEPRVTKTNARKTVEALSSRRGLGPISNRRPAPALHNAPR